LDQFRAALPGVDFLNPIAGIIINARNVMLYQQRPEWKLFLFDFVYAFILLLIGIFLLNKVGSKASEKL